MKGSFRDLVAFQRATQLMVEVYQLTKTFPREETYGLSSQMRRAAISVMANVAEGKRRVTYGEWRQFLSTARGSLHELEAELIAAERLGYVEGERLHGLARLIKRTGVAVNGLLAWVRSKETPRTRAPQNPSTPTVPLR